MIISWQTRILGPYGPLKILCSHPPPHYQHHHWQYHLQLQVFVPPLCKIFVPPYMIYLFIHLLIYLLKCFCTYRFFYEYLWYFFHKCYSRIAYIYTSLAFLFCKSIVIFHRNKSFHSTVDALGVSETMYMVKKAETYFWGSDGCFRRMFGLEWDYLLSETTV